MIINYITRYGSPLQEVLASKLTCFYNKVILKSKTRLICLLPENVQLHRAELHKNMFDELSVVQFNPSNSKFWESFNLNKFSYFVQSISSFSESNHVFIDHGKIFTRLPEITNQNIIVCEPQHDNKELMRNVNQILNQYCNRSLLEDEELKYYDCSLFYINDELKQWFHAQLRKIVIDYPEYCDVEKSYAIISHILSELKSSQNVIISEIKLEYQDITDSKLIDDFYTLI